MAAIFKNFVEPKQLNLHLLEKIILMYNYLVQHFSLSGIRTQGFLDTCLVQRLKVIPSSTKDVQNRILPLAMRCEARAGQSFANS